MKIELRDLQPGPVWLCDTTNAPMYYRADLPARAVGGRTVRELDVGLWREEDQRIPAMAACSCLILLTWIAGLGNPTVINLRSMFSDPLSERPENWLEILLQLRRQGLRVVLDHDDDIEAYIRQGIEQRASWMSRMKTELLEWEIPRAAEVELHKRNCAPFVIPTRVAMEVAYHDRNWGRFLKKAEARAQLGLKLLPEFIRSCDQHIVATEPLRAFILRHHPGADVRVAPNCIDPGDTSPVERPSDRRVRLGSAGGVSHLDDLPLILPGFLECSRLPGVELSFFGTHPAYGVLGYQAPGKYTYQGLPYRYFRQTTDFEAHRQAIGSLDVAVAPLMDFAHNRCKSAQRWFEHSLNGTAMVVSDLPPYACVEHGVTGFKAKTAEEFTEYLTLLCTDADLRRRMGQAARREVLEHHTVEARAAEWRAAVA